MATSDSLQDNELLAAWQAGERQAGAALFERHYESIARFFRNKVSGPAQDDLVQQAFLRCAEKADRFQGASSFRTFLFGIARNVLREYLRKVGRKRKYEADQELDLNVISVTALGQSPTSKIALQQEQRLLLEALRLIPIQYQVALELYYWEQFNSAEIAEIIGRPLGTIKTRLRDGKIILGKKLAAIASSEALLRSTMDNLDEWAARMREQARQ